VVLTRHSPYEAVNEGVAMECGMVRADAVAVSDPEGIKVNPGSRNSKVELIYKDRTYVTFNLNLYDLRFFFFRITQCVLRV